MRLIWHLILISQWLAFNVASALPLGATMPSPRLYTNWDRGAYTPYTPKIPSDSGPLSQSALESTSHRSPSTGSLIGMPFRTPLQLEHEAQTRSAGKLSARTAALLLETSRSDIVAGLQSLNTRTVQRLADAANGLKARVDGSIPLEHLIDGSNTMTTTIQDAA